MYSVRAHCTFSFHLLAPPQAGRRQSVAYAAAGGFLLLYASIARSGGISTPVAVRDRLGGRLVADRPFRGGGVDGDTRLTRGFPGGPVRIRWNEIEGDSEKPGYSRFDSCPPLSISSPTMRGKSSGTVGNDGARRSMAACSMDWHMLCPNGRTSSGNFPRRGHGFHSLPDTGTPREPDNRDWLHLALPSIAAYARRSPPATDPRRGQCFNPRR